MNTYVSLPIFRGLDAHGGKNYEQAHTHVGLWSAVCVKTQDDAGIYDPCWYLRFMLAFTVHAGIYGSCWYLRFMLVFTVHAGIYDPCWYLWSAVCVKTQDGAGIYDSCWYLRRMMLVFTLHAGIYIHFMLVFTIHAGIYTSCWYL